MRAQSKAKSFNRNGGFTLIELLVVISIIGILMGLMMPALGRAQAIARELTCRSNLRQAYLPLAMYADQSGGRYFVSEFEHNPHRPMLEAIGAYSDQSLLGAFYCTEANFSEQIATDPTRGHPLGATDSVIDTAENREAGRISYVYFSFESNKQEGGNYWRSPNAFTPRQLTTTYPDASKVWVLADFWRRGGGGTPGPVSFPHGRQTGGRGGGLNVMFLDGHADLVRGRPQDSFK